MELKGITKRSDLVMFESTDNAFGLIRMIPIAENDFLFNAKDCALVLEYKDAKKAIRRLVKDIHKIKILNKNLRLSVLESMKLNNAGELFITEEGLYRLIAASKMPKAEEFKSWVFGELIPTFRKTGKYDMSDLKKSKHRKLIKHLPGFKEDKGFKENLKRETSEISMAERVLKSTIWNKFVRLFNEVYETNLNLKISKFTKKHGLDEPPTCREYLDYVGLQKEAYIIFEMLRYGDDIRNSPNRLGFVVGMCKIYYNMLSEEDKLVVNMQIANLVIDGCIPNLDEDDYAIKRLI